MHLNTFPQLVSFPKNSHFRRLLDRLLGSPLEVKAYREHLAVMASNDLGELLLSKAYEKGTPLWVKIRRGSAVHDAYRQILPLPLGWRRLGAVHTHPRVPLIGGLDYLLNEVMNPFRFSVADVSVFLHQISSNIPVEGVVTPAGYGFMVASVSTKERIKQYGTLDTPLSENANLIGYLKSIPVEQAFNAQEVLPQYDIAYYSCFRRKEILERVI